MSEDHPITRQESVFGQECSVDKNQVWTVKKRASVASKASERSELVADSTDAFGDTHVNAFGVWEEATPDTHMNAFGA